MRDDHPEESEVQEMIAQAFATAFGVDRRSVVTVADIRRWRRVLEEQIRDAAVEVHFRDFRLAADPETRAAQAAIESADPMVSDDELIDRMEETSRVLQEMADVHGPARDADPQDEPIAPANPKLPIYRPR